MARVKKTLFSFIFAIICFCLTIVAVACGKDSVRASYKLDSYTYMDTEYEVGDGFYGISITPDLVQVSLKEDGSAELKISVAFITGSAAYGDAFTTYKGSYSESADSYTVVFPEYNSTPVVCKKTNRYVTINLNSYMTVVLVKQ